MLKYLCSIGACLAVSSVVALSQGASAPAARNDAAVAAANAIVSEISTLRELPVLRPVKSGTQSRTDIERMIVRKLDETPEEMHGSELVLRKLGLVPMGFQLRPFLLKLLTEQVAGYYDPEVHELYLADWIDIDGQRPVMAHELVHALQDQHFNLQRFEKWPPGDSDAESAVHALVEGDALLAMLQYVMKNPSLIAGFVNAYDSAGSAQIDQAPRVFREQLLFPYKEGMDWAIQLQRRGGWAALSAAFSKLPQSTEQILHLEKYDAYEAPLKITLPDLGDLLGRGWRRVTDDVDGEYGCYQTLDQFLNSPAESAAAAAGWGGDRYDVYEGPAPTDVFVAHLTAWDTARDAREYFDAYARRTGLRYPGATNAGGDANSHVWQTSEGRVTLQLRGSRVLILEGVPATATPGALLTRLGF